MRLVDKTTGALLCGNRSEPSLHSMRLFEPDEAIFHVAYHLFRLCPPVF